MQIMPSNWCADHRLHAISDQLARGQRELHSTVTHGDTVVHTDRIKFERHSASVAHGLLYPRAERL
jgi:hypothetical protein